MAGLVALGAALWLLHRLLTSSEGRGWALWIALGWVLATGIVASLASRHRMAGLSLCALGAAAAFVWRGPLLRNVERIYLLQHVGTMAVLAIWFGTTLIGSEPDLITRLATRVHGPLPPHIRRYTRQITAAWACLFAGIGIISIVLYLTAPLEWWSTFANLMTTPLIVAMFLIEYAVRVRRFPDFPHVSIFDGIRAWQGGTVDPRRP